MLLPCPQYYQKSSQPLAIKCDAIHIECDAFRKKFCFCFLSVLFIRIRRFFSLPLEKEDCQMLLNVFLASACTIMCFLSQSIKLVDSID